MTLSQNGVELFDSWADDYDRSVAMTRQAGAYPFAGYDDVVAKVVDLACVKSSHLVLDIGTGTGNLAAKLVNLAGEVWGTDFSGEMLRKAHEKVPQAHFTQWDLNDSWPAELPERLDRIVSTYAFHHLDDEAKVSLLLILAEERLLPGGHLVVGDIAFRNKHMQSECREIAGANWDDTEHYWVADCITPRLQRIGFAVHYAQISICGGVFALQRTDAR